MTQSLVHFEGADFNNTGSNKIMQKAHLAQGLECKKVLKRREQHHYPVCVHTHSRTCDFKECKLVAFCPLSFSPIASEVLGELGQQGEEGGNGWMKKFWQPRITAYFYAAISRRCEQVSLVFKL